MLADELLESVRHAVRGAGADGPTAALTPELFKVEIGISCPPVSGKLLWTRLSRAVRELTDGRSITDAAHSVGLADAAYLTRTFGSRLGEQGSERNSESKPECQNQCYQSALPASSLVERSHRR